MQIATKEEKLTVYPKCEARWWQHHAVGALSFICVKLMDKVKCSLGNTNVLEATKSLMTEW